MTARIELVDCERVILEEIAEKSTTRDDVALTYAMTMLSSESKTVDWPRINRAIIERWSMNALVYVKTQAWKKAEGRA